VFQAFEVEDKLRAHELHSGKSVVDVHQHAGWGVRGTSVVVEETGFENEVQDVGVILGAKTAMFINLGSLLERFCIVSAHEMTIWILGDSKLCG
jgi:hypothetical protein